MTGAPPPGEKDPRERGRERACEAFLHAEFGRRSEAFSDRVLSALRSGNGTASGGQRFRVKTITALAAMLLAAIGLGWLMLVRGPAEVAAARISEVEGEASVRRGTTSIPAAPGIAFGPGDHLETAADGRVVLEWADKAGPSSARLEIGSDSRLAVRPPSGRSGEWNPVPVLARGRLAARVDRQVAGSVFAVDTPHAQVAVVGTVFTLAVSPDGRGIGDAFTTVEVQEGTVRVTRTADGASLAVTAGHGTTVAGSGRALEVSPLATPSRIVFAHEFDAVEPGEQIRGTLTRTDGLTTITSIPTRGPPTFPRDQQIELGVGGTATGGDVALFVLPEQVEIRIRIRSERPGRWGISHQPVDPQPSFPEHFYSGEYAVGPEWSEAVLHLEDLVPYRREGPTRDPVPGLGITGFVISGFGGGRLSVDRYQVINRDE